MDSQNCELLRKLKPPLALEPVVLCSLQTVLVYLCATPSATLLHPSSLAVSGGDALQRRSGVRDTAFRWGRCDPVAGLGGAETDTAATGQRAGSGRR